LCAFQAADWALRLARRQGLEHSQTGGAYGENLYYAGVSDMVMEGQMAAVSPAHAVFSWWVRAGEGEWERRGKEGSRGMEGYAVVSDMVMQG
jgi:energy-converting hydrogenase Eha subunit F